MFKFIVLVSTFLIGTQSATLSREDSWRIVGGSAAKDGEFPYMASLRIDDFHNCGGSIISDRYIMTAAHCIAGFGDNDYTIVLGTNKISGDGERYASKRVIPHPNYETKTGYDIGLIELEEPIKFNKKIQKIELEDQMLDGGVELTLSGWGQLGAWANSPDNLQKITLKSISVAECQKKAGNTNDHEICTYTKIGEGACYGDSGGPLVSNVDGKCAGIVSRGYPCAIGKPDIFTRVSAHTEWILGIINA